MKFVFFASEKDREIKIAGLLAEGLKHHGHKFSASFEGFHDDCDVAIMFGVKSKPIFDAARKARKRIIFLDKGYTRTHRRGLWGYIRFAVDAHSPTHYLMKVEEGSERFRRLGEEIKPWKKSGSRVLFAGSSEKYHKFFELPHPDAYAKAVIEKINAYGEFQVTYRPKPSWDAAKPIEGSCFSFHQRDIRADLAESDIFVTHGSNACFEALIEGVPCVILGPAVARPVSVPKLSHITHIHRSPLREQLLRKVAHCQWTPEEIASGEGVEHMLRHMEIAL